MEVGIENLKKLAHAIDDLVEIGEDIAEGGINADYVMHLPRLVSPVKAIYECVKELKAMGDEAKDLDWNELKEIISVFSE